MPRVIVAGGGPAGAVTALVLARIGIEVAVYERSPGPAHKPGDCLAPNTRPMLERLGLMHLLENGPHLRTFGNRSAWGAPGAVDRDFIAEPHGHGWRLDRRDFESALARTAQDAGAQWMYHAAVRSAQWDGARWRVRVVHALRGEFDAAPADFVVDATGRRAALARRLGIVRVRYGRLIALAGELSGGHGIEDTFTLVESAPGGWWYSGALPRGRLALFFATDHGLPEYAEARTGAGWRRLLQDAPHTLARVRAHGGSLIAPPRAWAASAERLASISGRRWIAAGDAAAAYDPISSHGVGSAIGSGYYAARTVADLLAGREEARDTYHSLMQQTFQTFLDTCREPYLNERRWPDRPFWRVRHQAGG